MSVMYTKATFSEEIKTNYYSVEKKSPNDVSVILLFISLVMYVFQKAFPDVKTI